MMEEVVNPNLHSDENFRDIEVLTIIEPNVSFVQYEVIIKTNDTSFKYSSSNFLRRYSDFHSLHYILKKQFPSMKLPVLPPKSPFKKVFDLDFIEKRRHGLEKYLAELVSKKIYLSSKALHLFLQSSYSIAEIQNIIRGKIVIKEENETEKDSANESPPDLRELRDVASSEVPPKTTLLTDSPLGTKKVSFCDQVTVAEIHVS